MTIGVLQQSATVAISSGNVTTLAATLPNPPTAGNMLVYFLTVDKSSGIISDGNGFTVLRSEVTSSVSIAIAGRTADGEEDESSILGPTWATSQDAKAFIIELSSSVGGAIAFDTANSNSTTSSVLTLGTNSITLAAAAAYAVTLMGKDSAKASDTDPDPTASWSDGFSMLAQNWFASFGTGEPGFAVGGRTVTGPGSLSSTFTHDGSTDQLACAIVSFTETGGGGGGASSKIGPRIAGAQNRRIL